MKYFKLLFLSVAACLFAEMVSDQVKQSVTIAPSSYPDNTIKPAVIIADPQERNAVAEKEIPYETITVAPESKLSIGKASAIPVAESEKAARSSSREKNKINYSEQRIEKQEAPVSNPSVN